MLNMFPASSFNDACNRRWRDSINSGEDSSLIMNIKMSDFSDIFRRKFVTVVFFAPTISRFCEHVRAVVFLSPEKKVGNFNAISDITFMANKHAFRDEAFSDGPMETGCDRLPFPVVKGPISVVRFCPGKKPARRGFLDIFEEVFGKIFSHGNLQFLCHSPQGLRLGGDFYGGILT